MKKIQATAALLLGVLISQSVLADSPTAIHNFYTNLARARTSLAATEINTVAIPTLVRGMYKLTSKQGQFISYTNEAGTLFGDAQGFKVISASGIPLRQLNLDEVAGLRAEVLSGLDYDKLIKVQHGDGGGRRIILFSAVDCPFCKKFEDAMREIDNNVNTTFYVVPSSLRSLSRGGELPKWQAVSNIWCAEDNGAAWLAFWGNRRIAAPRQCEFADPRNADASVQNLYAIFQAAGMNIVGTPNLVREDGVINRLNAGFDVAWAKATLGPAGMPPAVPQSNRWLGANASFQAPTVDSVIPMPANSSQPKSVNLKAALGNLFGK